MRLNDNRKEVRVKKKYKSLPYCLAPLQPVSISHGQITVFWVAQSQVYKLLSNSDTTMKSKLPCPNVVNMLYSYQWFYQKLC